MLDFQSALGGSPVQGRYPVSEATIGPAMKNQSSSARWTDHRGRHLSLIRGLIVTTRKCIKLFLEFKKAERIEIGFEVMKNPDFWTKMYKKLFD